MEKYLSEEEVQELLVSAKSGDNRAWESLYHNFEDYVHKCAWNRLRKSNIPEYRKSDVEEELFQAGWKGFLASIYSYDPEKGKFLTYATHFIEGEMSKELDFARNPSGIKAEKNLQVAKGLISRGAGLSVEYAPDLGKYSPERRVLQIMDVLRLLTDEKHSLSKGELGELLRLYRFAKYQNGTPIEAANTLTGTIEDLLTEVNPTKYTGKNDGEYRIKYEGYKEGRLKAKQNKENKKKAAAITGFSYVHTFDYAELDRLIQLVCFSDMLSNEEKKRLVEKLMSTASAYYETPFYDYDRKELRFNPKAVHGRFSAREAQNNKHFVENINLILQAVNGLCQIRFKFNEYTAGYKMVPKSEYLHVLSPYHLVVYHDNYYCIGLRKGDKHIRHYRVDLMSDVEILTDDDGRNVPIDLCAFEGLPISNADWDPEKYMAEHLYMGYDEPKEILIKIKNDDYTILHDWFGNHYEKTKQPCEEGYDIVKVRTSPFMIVHWAMQYAGAVEVMDEKIREEIRKEIKILKDKYE